jgi:hypothetical protein
MPVTPSAVTGAIIAAGPTLKGPDWIRLASVLGIATTTWIQSPSNLAMQGVTVGAIGAGAVSGKFLMAPVPIIVPGVAASAGLLGFISPQMASAVGMGVGISFNASANYFGASAGVGAGTDISKVVFSNPATLAALIVAVGAAQGMVGFDLPRLAGAYGSGIASLFLTGTGAGAVAGPAGPLPSGGTSISRVI